jgi:transcriptional regulator with XRE-family HTH domain
VSGEGSHQATHTPPQDLPDKLDRLFRAARSRRGGDLTYREVAVGIMQLGFARISGTYVWELRTGRRNNPSLKHIEGLAAFFGVPVNYFFNDDIAALTSADLELIVAQRDADIRRIAVRSAGLSAESLAAVADLVEHLRHIEGLPEVAHNAVASSGRALGSRDAADRPT